MSYKDSKDSRNVAAKRRWVENNRATHNASCRASRARLKAEVFNHYGTVCACCGETEAIFLTIDHINGGGQKHRRELGGGGFKLYLWLRRNNFPSGFQTLCMNCQFGKAYMGTCSHQLSKSVIEVAT